MSVKVIKIGRTDDNDIVINDGSVSRNHAELFINLEDDVFILTDLGSTNGTYVNGRRITDSVQLKKKDIVKIGNAPPIKWKNYLTVNTSTGNEITKNGSEDPDNDKDINSNRSGKSNTDKISKISGILVAVAVVVTLLLSFFLLSKSNNNDSFFSNDDQTEKEDQNNETDETDDESNPNHSTNKEKAITYDYSCLGNDLRNEMGDLESEMLDDFFSDIKVSLAEEIETGQQLHEGVSDEYEFVYDNRLDKIKAIKNALNSKIQKPRGFDYRIYLINSDEINAFTAGGYIYVTTGIYDFVNNPDELACIIGHEMAHNECGHINYHLKKEKANKEFFGDFFGSAADNLSYFLTISFNQKRETESDFHGIDYAKRAGYNVCAVTKLWDRMSENEGQQNGLDDLMRSHPYSEKRSLCCREHILNNYGINCPN